MPCNNLADPLHPLATFVDTIPNPPTPKKGRILFERLLTATVCFGNVLKVYNVDDTEQKVYYLQESVLMLSKCTKS